MTDPRHSLEEYVASAKVMQLATIDETGAPQVCHLWFAASLAPDRLWFVSQPDSGHCAQIRRDIRVAGAILDAVIDEPGGTPVRGVSFTGRGRELPTSGVDAQVAVYLARWPKADDVINPQRLAADETDHRIYEIIVDGWVLFDENSDVPRQVVDVK